MLWGLIAALTFGVAVLSLTPLLRGAAPVSALDHAVAFYAARRRELLRQREGQLISDLDLANAEAEQARRLIAIGKRDQAERRQVPAQSGAWRKKIAALVLMTLIPAGAIATYLILGRPWMPDQPLSTRAVAARNLDIVAALAKIEAHLAKNPEDGRGYAVVAPVYLKLGRFDDAALAYRKVVDLLGENPERLGDLGESLVALGSGVISIEARKVFERSLVLDPDFHKSRFYLALAIEQDGNLVEAAARLRALVAAMPAGVGRSRVQIELDRLTGQPAREGTDPASEAGAAIAALPEAERAAAIRGMVDGLEERLRRETGTAEEWLRLLRARMTLGEDERARQLLSAAREALKADSAALARINLFARTFRVEGGNPLEGVAP